MSKWLTAVLISLIPSNLFLKFFVDSAYVHGLLVDYLIPKLFVSDLVIFALLGLWLWENVPLKINWPKINKWLVLLLVLFFIRQLFTSHPLASVWYFFKLMEMFALGFYFLHHQNIFKSKIIHWSLLLTLAFQSLLAIYQFHTQHSLFGYYFFGEPNLSNYIGLAKGVFDGAEKTLPYGTTAHPNILGGFIAVTLLILYTLRNKVSNKIVFFLTIAIAGYALYLTQSISAWLILLTAIALFLGQKYFNNKGKLKVAYFVLFFLIVTPLTFQLFSIIYPTNNSLVRREYLQRAAIKMIWDQPLVGVGLNNFTAEVENYTNNPEIVRFVQPTHHVIALWLSETGLLGLTLVLLIWKLFTKEIKSEILLALVIISPIVFLDHYLLTTQTGLLLLILWLTFRAPHSPASRQSLAATDKYLD